MTCGGAASSAAGLVRSGAAFTQHGRGCQTLKVELQRCLGSEQDGGCCSLCMGLFLWDWGIGPMLPQKKNPALFELGSLGELLYEPPRVLSHLHLPSTTGNERIGVSTPLCPPGAGFPPHKGTMGSAAPPRPPNPPKRIPAHFQHPRIKGELEPLVSLFFII